MSGRSSGMSKLKHQLKSILPLLSEEANRCRDREVRERLDLIKGIIKSPKSLTKACAAAGKSTDWFGTWAKRLIKERSLEALKSRSRRPKHSANKTPKRIEKRVMQIRKAQPFLGPERVQDDLKRLFNMHCPVTTIYRILKRNKLITQATKQRTTKKHIKRYRRFLPGFCQMDVKYVPQLILGKQLYQFNFVDHCTTWRFTRVYPSLSHAHVRMFLEELQSNCPFPIIEIQTDNGSEFTDKYRGGRLTPSGQHVLDLWCKEHSIRHKLIPIGQKELNGKVENTHKQDDREFYSQNIFRSFAEVRILIGSHNERWNTRRRTKALGWKTPDEALETANARALAWISLLKERYQINKDHIIVWDKNLNASIRAPDPKKIKKGPSPRKRASTVNRYLQYQEWSRKKSS